MSGVGLPSAKCCVCGQITHFMIDPPKLDPFVCGGCHEGQAHEQDRKFCVSNGLLFTHPRMKFMVDCTVKYLKQWRFSEAEIKLFVDAVLEKIKEDDFFGDSIEGLDKSVSQGSRGQHGEGNAI